MRILIAEDDFTSRSVLYSILKKQGYEVVATKDGNEAWDTMKTPDAPRLAVFDWMMPGIDGIDLCRKIRNLDTGRQPYLIMLTSLNQKEHLAKAMESGIDDFISKPFEHTELKARIAAAERIIRLQDRLRDLAMTDELTGLPNRRAVKEVIQREIARAEREGSGIGIGMVDIDHFKRINDTYGHSIGDDALREVADRLCRSLRSYDTICRYGGEEFLVVIPGKAERIHWNRLNMVINEAPIVTKAGSLDVTVSIGYVCEHGRLDPDELIDEADRALYRAKESGRNRVERGFLTKKPVDSVHEGLSGSTSDQGLTAGEATEKNAQKILIAEDDFTSREVLKNILERLGYDVIAVNDGQSAWEVLANPDSPRLAVLDWMMPGLDGLDVCRKVKTKHQDDPRYIIILTTLNNKEHLTKGFESGADDYIAKPFDQGELKARISVGLRTLEIQERLINQADDLRTALNEIKTLKGLIPICMHCKKIRNDNDFWQEVEAYVEAHSEAMFSHSLCPECLDKYYLEED